MSDPILGMDVADLGELLAGQPAYRARQLYQAIYREGATDLRKIITLPAALREDLAARHGIGMPSIAQLYESTDGTRRYLLGLDDGKTVETVLMPEGERDT